ncbi:hypothetical protein QFZ83_005987 [Variovorax sp. W1I1]|nr:hypothetical protein [Variovorax sp. W1I1]MDQ0611816.1 hypothetical protein [Variovorax sp. W1I1]
MDASVLGDRQENAQLLQLHLSSVIPVESLGGFHLVISMKICDSALARFA